METDGIYVKHEGGKVIANMTTERERERESRARLVEEVGSAAINHPSVEVEQLEEREQKESVITGASVDHLTVS